MDNRSCMRNSMALCLWSKLYFLFICGDHTVQIWNNSYANTPLCPHSPILDHLKEVTLKNENHTETYLNTQEQILINPESVLYIRGRSFSFKMSLSSSDCFVIFPVWHAWLKGTRLCWEDSHWLAISFNQRESSQQILDLWFMRICFCMIFFFGCTLPLRG